MQHLLLDILKEISSYLLISDILKLIQVNKRFYQLKLHLIDAYQKRNIQIWSGKCGLLLGRMRNSKKDKKRIIKHILQLALDYPILNMQWEEVEDNLKQNLISLFCDLILISKRTASNFEISNCTLNNLSNIYRLSASLIFGPKTLLESFNYWSSIREDIIKYLNYISATKKTVFQHWQKYSFKSGKWYQNLMKCKKYCPEVFYSQIKNKDFTLNQWTQLFKIDLKACGDSHYFKNRDKVIEFYYNKVKPNCLRNILSIKVYSNI